MGIKSSQENAAARSFVFLGSMEDSGLEPVLQRVAVPDPAAFAQVVVGITPLVVRQRN